MIRSFILMLTFLTRIPIKIKGIINSSDFAKGVIFMPLVGFIIGLFMSSIFYLSNWLEPLVVSLLIWIFYICITGGLHLDGLADTFDGIFSNRDKDKILEIMKDSRVGTFGLIGIVIILISNIILTSYINLVIILITPIIGRSIALMACSISNYAKDNGLGKDLINYCGVKELIISFLYPSIILGILSLLNVLSMILVFSILVTYIITFLIIKYISNKINGMTGDTIGCVIELSQCVFLLTTYLIGEIAI